MPDAAPRNSGGTLPIIEDVLGALNMPMPMPLMAMRVANAQ